MHHIFQISIYKHFWTQFIISISHDTIHHILLVLCITFPLNYTDIFGCTATKCEKSSQDMKTFGRHLTKCLMLFFPQVAIMSSSVRGNLNLTQFSNSSNVTSWWHNFVAPLWFPAARWRFTANSCLSCVSPSFIGKLTYSAWVTMTFVGGFIFKAHQPVTAVDAVHL